MGAALVFLPVITFTAAFYLLVRFRGVWGSLLRSFLESPRG